MKKTVQKYSAYCILPFISNSRKSNYFKRLKTDQCLPGDHGLAGREIIRDHKEIYGGDGYIP